MLFKAMLEIKMIRYGFNDLFVFILTINAGGKTLLEAALYDKRLNPGRS